MALPRKVVDGKEVCHQGHSESFYINSANMKKCRECERLIEARYRAKNKEQRNAYSREYGTERRKSEEYRVYMRQVHKAYALKYPDKRKAHHLLQNAVRDKRIIKPTECDRCNATGLIHGHHNDYSRPFDVMWLCIKCHEWMHHSKVGEAI